MGLIHRYSLELFKTLCRFWYPRVGIDFYQTMTSLGERHPTALHFTIDCRQGLLRAADIATSFQLPVALANSTNFRQWHNPSPREIVWVLSRNTCVGLYFSGGIFLQKFSLWTTYYGLIYSLYNMLYRGEAPILEALFRISKGFWFGLEDLIMTSLFHFKERIQIKNINRAEANPLLLSRPLSHVLEHLGFPAEPHRKRRHVCEATFTVEKL